MTPLLEPPDGPSLQAEVARFGAIGAEEKPGTSYSYSNPGYNTLGALIEVVAGQPLEAYLKEHLYAPLGMTDTCNHESRAKHARMSAVFRRESTGAGWRVRWQPGDDPDYPFVRASGGMISTPRDYLAFCQMFLDRGRHGDARILSERSVAAATSPQTTH